MPMGMIIFMLHQFRCSVFSYQRRFPVAYFDFKVMLRPLLVNINGGLRFLHLYVNKTTNKNKY